MTREEELIERLMREDEDYIKIKMAHTELGRQLDELEKKPFLTPQDEMEIKIIKKKKLVYKDEMEKILTKHRSINRNDGKLEDWNNGCKR